MAADGDVRVVRFAPEYAKAFADLNYDWIEHYFRVEEHDRHMLDNPAEEIIDRGGEIFIAVADEEPVGAVALINSSDDTFELAKMAVSPAQRGRGIGDKLIVACIEYARENGKSRIYLLSNTRLTPAIELYRKHGFIETPLDADSPYERVNIRMELALNSGKL
jgi:GNAT superfamily N-acetyltransferase